jgi:adenosylcobinamide-GDP ribazoletransferase
MLTDALALRVADFAACLRFFSRLPVRRLGRRDDPMALPEMPRAASMMPLAGALIAVPAALLAFVSGYSHLPPFAIGLVVVVALTLPTGALHEDGLADSADGLIGGGNRDKRLEIMKDSRVGAFGALALVVVIGLRASLYGELVGRGGAMAVAVPIAAGGLSRLAMVWLWQRLPNARPDGLAGRLGAPDFDAAVGASLAGLIVALPLVPVAGPLPLAAGVVLATLAAFGLGALAKAKIGGQTGDILGATQVIAETALLLGLAAV